VHVTTYIQDFVDVPTLIRRKVKGFTGKSTQGIHVGTIRWMIEDDEGVVHEFLIPDSLYVPEGSSRLLSPQHWAQVAKDHHPLRYGTWCATYPDKIILYWNQRQYTRTIPLDPSDTNVATIHTAPGYTRYHAFCAKIGQDDTDNEGYDPDLAYDTKIVSDDEANESSESEEDNSDDDSRVPRSIPLVTDFKIDGPEEASEPPPTVIEDEEDTDPQDSSAELLRWHHRFGHISFKKLQMLAKMQILPKKLSTCKVPLCTSCLFGKATRRPWRSKTSKSDKSRRRTITRPGQCVSVDQLESTTPGLIAQMKGKPTTKRYTAATVFVDHYSGFTYVYIQKSTSADETIQGKQAFEQFARSQGVTILHYHADNGRFADNKWRQACTDAGQTLTFCGVNAHFQNGIAERRIRELQEHARTMLIHAHKRWATAIDTHLWPYALRMANDILNNAPDIKRGQPPLQLFTGTQVSMNPKHWYHFGCPVYVLDDSLQAGKKIDKWSERRRIGIYLGQSPQHGRTVGLVLSLETGLTSPQFHITMDTSFHTLRTAFGGHPPTSQWQAKCHFHKLEQPLESSKVPEGGKSSKTDKGSTLQHKEYNSQDVRTSQEHSSMQQGHDMSIHADTFPNRQEDHLQQRDNLRDNLTLQEDQAPHTQEDQEPHIQEDQEPHLPLENQNIDLARDWRQLQPLPDVVEAQHEARRSSRQTRRPDRLIEAMAAEIANLGPYNVPYEVLATPIMETMFETSSNPLIALAASADPDTMYYHQAMKQPDREEFIKAMIKEVESQQANGNWRIVKASSVPEGATILPSVWAMKRKRRIATREVYKWKSRLNLDGSKQKKGVNFWETYAPVASWAAIWLILTMVIIKGWKTRQIDYVLAYTQADAEWTDMYMKIPKGFQIPGEKPGEYVLKIEKNIYGGKQAGRVWNKHLVSRLESIGFHQSKIDECIFYRGKTIYVLYTDDSILAGPDEQEIEEILEDMKKAKLDITVEGDICDFLGVKIDRRPDGTIHLTQPHLIEQILEEVRLDGDNVTTKLTPSKGSILKRYPNSEPFDKHFDYRRVIGKLNYLEKSTRPEIAFQVHQCARFAANPKKEHGYAIMWICRYLAATRDKGLIFKPTAQSFDCYVDADFSGNWDKEEASTTELDTARSRTGYLITYAGCPILWASKLQTLIALSTTEAEYVALSTALRDVIPLMELVKDLQQHGFDFTATQPTVHCRVFEDNSGAIEIANVHKWRPRTKHINTQFHHFRHHVTTKQIIILPIDTESQPADIMTKMVTSKLFHQHRKTIMGW